MRIRGLVLPSTFDLLFILLAMVIPLGRGVQLLNTDGDLARHLRVGDFLLSRRALFYEDQFSHTMAGRPFVPYEWLSEVSFAVVHQLGGLPAVAVFTGLVIALTYALVALFLRQHGVDPLLAFLIGALGATLGAVHWLARPHIFTTLGAIVLLALLEARTQRPWLYLPLFVVWANLHGGFIFGLVVIGAYLAGDLAESLLAGQDRSWRQRARQHALALLVAAGASCLTPSGPSLFAHVAGYFGKRFLIDQTIEYQSPDFHLPYAQLFLAVVVLIVGALALSPRRPTLPRLFLLIGTLAFALYAARNIPLFAVTALPVVAFTLDPLWRQVPAIGRFREAWAAVEQRSGRGLWAGGLAVALGIAAVVPGHLGLQRLAALQFDPARFPVAAVERARTEGLTGRIYNELGWGGYILYAWPEQRVFIDGQTDFYGEELARTYVRVHELQPGWRQALSDWQISLVIVPRTAALAQELTREPAWTVWHQDATAVILRRVEPATTPPPEHGAVAPAGPGGARRGLAPATAG